MAGIDYKVIGKTLFDFSKVAGSQYQEIVLASAIPSHDYRYGQLLFRYHANNGTPWNAGQSIDVRLRAEASSDEDPKTDFIYPTDIAMASISNNPQEPTFIPAAISATIPAQLRVVIRGTQPASPATLSGYISVSLSLKA